MGLENGIPKSLLLGTAYRQIKQEPGLTYATYDEAMEMVFFSVQARGVERRYRLVIEKGRPLVTRVE